MAQDTSGTPRKLTINGISYRLVADINISKLINEYENDMMATSGRGMLKKTRRVPKWENVIVGANGAEQEQLRGYADSMDDLKITAQEISGNTYRCEGAIEISSVETESNRVTMTILPRENWTPFLAS